MLTKRHMAIASMLSLALLAGASARAGTADGSVWRTIATTGRVEVKLQTSAGDAWLPARRGADVSALSLVRTFVKARTTLTRDGDLILVAADSEVVLPDRAPDGATRVLQHRGHVVYKVAPRHEGGRFEVRTPLLVAGVKGTRFSVILERDRAAVSVIEGVVEVRSTMTGETGDLTAGMVGVVSAGDGHMEIHQEADRDARPDRARRERGVREGDSDTAMLDDTLSVSRKLAASLVEADDSLLDLDSGEDADLWGDLMDDTQTLTRSSGELVESSTSRLDPTSSEKTSDPTLIGRLLNLLKGN